MLRADEKGIYPIWYDPMTLATMGAIMKKVTSSVGGGSVALLRRFTGPEANPIAPSEPYRLPATAPVGRRTPMQSAADQAAHNPQLKLPDGKTSYRSEVIEGRVYSEHASGRMSTRGLVPSVIENTIKTAEGVVNEAEGTIRYYDALNKVGVIINKITGVVITVE
jgi:hypothetical protein